MLTFTQSKLSMVSINRNSKEKRNYQLGILMIICITARLGKYKGLSREEINYIKTNSF